MLVTMFLDKWSPMGRREMKHVGTIGLPHLFSYCEMGILLKAMEIS